MRPFISKISFSLAGVGIACFSSTDVLAETYLVKFNPNMKSFQVKSTLKQVGVQSKKYFQEIGYHVVRTQKGKKLNKKKIKKLIKEGQILRIEENAKVKLFRDPDERSYFNQRGMRRLGTQRAWDRATGSRNVIVAVVDSGVDLDHPDLVNQIWKNPKEIPGNEIDDDGNGFVDDVHGWDFVQKDNTPDDEMYHGTHVAGIIGAEGNNSQYVAGVNWKVTIMPVRAFGKRGEANHSDAIAAILYAAKNGAHIINNSWGGGPRSDAMREAFRYAHSKGILSVNAAGNSKKDIDRRPQYPAAYKSAGIISVASNSKRGGLSHKFTNFGQLNVDIAAPGDSILSTVSSSKICPGESGLGKKTMICRLSGTSMAAPMVSGVAALIKSVNPELEGKDLRNAVLNAIDPYSHYIPKVATGGDLRADLALEQLENGFQVWPQQISLAVGRPYPFSAFQPNGAVSWSVDQPDLATIDEEGVLTPLAEGNVTVTARDGSGAEVSTKRVTLKKEHQTSPGGGGGCAPRQVAGTKTLPQHAGMALSSFLPLLFGFASMRRRRKKEQSHLD